MSKKYELVENDYIDTGWSKLFRVRYLRDFADVKAGDLGGYIESEKNLLQDGDARVLDDARVYAKGNVGMDAVVKGDAVVAGNAYVSCRAVVKDNAVVTDNAAVSGDAVVGGFASLHDTTHVVNNAVVGGCTILRGNTALRTDAQVTCNEDYLTIGPALSSGRTTTAYRTNKGGVSIHTGCFLGNLEEFRASIAETHEHSPLYRAQYNAFADLIEVSFKGKPPTKTLLDKFKNWWNSL